MPALSVSAFVKIAGSACATAISLIHVQRVSRAMKRDMSRAKSFKMLFADSESQILATKKFFVHNA
jgi:hypothetical protein